MANIYYVISIYSPLSSEAHLFCWPQLWPWARPQENVEPLGPGDLVQLVDLRMTELNGEQGYILRLVPGHKEERVEVALFGTPWERFFAVFFSKIWVPTLQNGKLDFANGM